MPLPMPGAEPAPTFRRAVPAARGLALAGLLGAATLAGAAAQDATPGATPDAMTAECMPAAAAEMMAAEATPAADAAPEIGAATPASDEIAGRATAVVENFVACWNVGDLGATLGLVTPNLLQTSFGVADAMAAEAALPELDLGPITITELGEVATYGDGRASIEVGYARGDYQHVAARWYMVERDGQLLIDEEELLPPAVEGDKAFVQFAVADDASPVVFSAFSEVSEIPVLVLHGVNDGAERHVFQVVALPAMDGTPEPGALPEGGRTIGLVSIGPGERAELALAGLPVGSYALVDPAVEGSVATLTVVAPAEDA